MEKNGAHYIERIRRKVMFCRITEVFLWSITTGLTVAIVSALFGVPFWWLAVAAMSSAAVVFVLMGFLLKKINTSTKEITRLLDFTYARLENSSDLLLADERKLTALQRLQRKKVENIIPASFSHIRYPRIPALPSLALAATLVMLLLMWINESGVIQSKIQPASELGQRAIIIPALGSVTITITPPAYTGIPKFQADQSHLTLPEGSLVEWDVTFTDSVHRAQLILNNTDTLPLKPLRKHYRSATAIHHTSFYQLQWTTDSATRQSEFYRIAVAEDNGPDIRIVNLQQFTRRTIHDDPSIDVSVTIRDDHGLTDGYLIATVSKGSGESVKFREEKLAFDSPKAISGKQVSAVRTISLAQMGLEPGDELYFYAIAFDNRVPEKNYTRTETYFIALQDTTNLELSVDAGLGVDLMPEYFRSQRQIIIDSEKLLHEKKKISQTEFKARSNDLAHDQKVLRLRYGQFLGEEFESGIVHDESHEGEKDDHQHAAGDQEEDVARKFGHVHDSDDEHRLPGDDDDHGHADASEDPEKKNDPLEGFIHRHDDPEEATFFTQSIRAKLKATLTLMWDAELHLRLADPQKSLPYQYKALRLLKEISNDSRIYVHRTGFDPPPIKEEKRLTGDLDEVKSSHVANTVRAQSLPATRSALKLCDAMLLQKVPRLTNEDVRLLENAGVELGQLALQRPGQFLNTLSLIQKVASSRPAGTDLHEALHKLAQQLQTALPRDPVNPSRREAVLHDLDSVFVQNLFQP